MVNKEKNTRKRKRLWIIAGIITLTIAVVLIGVNSYLGLKIKNVIESEINKNPESAYSIHYDKIGINIYTGSFHIKDLVLEPRKKKKDDLALHKKGSSFSLKMKSFKINRVDIFDFLETKKLKVKNIKVNDINFELIIDKSTKQNEPKTNHEPLNILTKGFRGVLVNKIQLNNLSLKITDVNKPDKLLLDLHSLSFSITNVLLDSTTIVNQIPVSMESLNLKTKEFVYNSLDYYTISTSGFDFMLKDSTLKISNFKFVPKYSKAEYNKKIKYEHDLFSIKTKEIILHDIHLHKLIFNKSLHLPSLEIISPDIDIYRDKRLPDAPYKYKPLIASAIKKIPIPLIIDTLSIKKGKLLYGEMQDVTDKPGEIIFNDLYISAYNLTNDANQISQRPQLQLDLSAKLMGTTNLDVTLQFDLDKTGDYFSVKGKLGKINGNKLNKMVENLLLVRIQSADIHSASFSFMANDTQSNGIMKMDYENLKVKLVKSEKNKEYKALSFLANELINKNNLADSQKYKTGTILFTRDKNKGFPNYLWKSILSGLIPIIAPMAESKEQKEIRKGKQGKKTKKKRKKDR